jgi:hypothetical protein
MASLLTGRKLALGLFLLVVAAGSLSAPLFVARGLTYSGWSTGYAFGNLCGASGSVVVQGHYANHSTMW